MDTTEVPANAWAQILTTGGQHLAAARAAQEVARDHAIALAIAATADGYPEAATARHLGVDRMTVRNWTGKR